MLEGGDWWKRHQEAEQDIVTGPTPSKEDERRE